MTIETCSSSAARPGTEYVLTLDYQTGKRRETRRAQLWLSTTLATEPVDRDD